MQHRLPTLVTSLAIGITFAGAALVLIGSEAKARPVAVMPLSMETAYVLPNAKVAAVFDKATTSTLLTKDEMRKVVSNIRTLMAANEIRSGTDYALAAAVVAKGESLQDAMLAHDLAICALALGNSQAKTLAAVSQDLILARLGQKQRYGTKVTKGKLEPVEQGVSDAMRMILGLPSLTETKRLVSMGKSFVPPITTKSAVMSGSHFVSPAIAVTN